MGFAFRGEGNDDALRNGFGTQRARGPSSRIWRRPALEFEPLGAASVKIMSGTSSPMARAAAPSLFPSL